MPDLRYALRAFLKQPGFFLLAIGTLATGIGAAASMFSFVVAWIVDPLSFPKPDRLMYVEGQRAKTRARINVSGADYRDLSERSQTFESLAAYSWQDYTLSGGALGEEVERVTAAGVSANFFDLLGVKLAMGRGFEARNEIAGNHRVAVVASDFSRLKQAAVGSTLQLDGETYTVIGVLPADFQFALMGRRDVWTPVAADPAKLANRGERDRELLGRLKAGVSVAAANAELASMARELETRYPDTNRDVGFSAIKLADEMGEHSGNRFVVLTFAITIGLMLIASANVANLLLVRAIGRQRQSAIQLSLGASAARLAGQALAETVMLFAIAAGVGALAGVWITDWFSTLIPPQSHMYLPHFGVVSMNWTVFLCALGFSLCSGLLFGLAPALESIRVDLNSVLKESGSAVSQSRGRGRLRAAFVVGQLLIATLLVSTTAVLVQNLHGIWATDPGFDPAKLLTFAVSLDARRYEKPRQRLAFFERVEADLRRIAPAAVCRFTPNGNEGGSTRFSIEGRAVEDARQLPSARYNAVSAEFFGVMKTPLIAGRMIAAADGPDAPGVAVINESMARRMFDGRNPLGEHLRLKTYGDRLVEIVGVVKDIRYLSIAPRNEMQVHVAFAQAPARNAMFVMRTTPSSAQAIGAVVRGADKLTPIHKVASMDELMYIAFEPFEIVSGMAGAFGLIALALAAVGVYGVVSFTAFQRMREFGIRAALGASRGELASLVVRQGGLLVAIGLVPGMLLAFGAGRLLVSLIDEVKTLDPLPFVLTPLVLAVAALAATVIPALRASGVDPARALRGE